MWSDLELSYRLGRTLRNYRTLANVAPLSRWRGRFPSVVACLGSGIRNAAIYTHSPRRVPDNRAGDEAAGGPNRILNLHHLSLSFIVDAVRRRFAIAQSSGHQRRASQAHRARQSGAPMTSVIGTHCLPSYRTICSLWIALRSSCDTSIVTPGMNMDMRITFSRRYTLPCTRRTVLVPLSTHPIRRANALVFARKGPQPPSIAKRRPKSPVRSNKAMLSAPCATSGMRLAPGCGVVVMNNDKTS